MSKAKTANKQQARTTTKVSFTDKAWADYQFWKKHDAKVSESVDWLIQECMRTPFTGIGKPEGLKGSLSGFWSRRITREHRLVYMYENGELFILACRYHYES